MFSFESWLSGEKFLRQSADSAYWPELITRSAAAIASAHRAGPFCRPAAVTVPVNTCALRYRLARIAFAAPEVTRPASPAGRDAGRTVRVALSSDSTNRKTESRGTRAVASTFVLVTSGTPPKRSIRL